MDAAELRRRRAGERNDGGVGVRAAAEADAAQDDAGSVGVTLTTSSGSAGSPGLVTTPSGPESHVARRGVLVGTFVSVDVSWSGSA